jgi:hypothetical protein
MTCCVSIDVALCVLRKAPHLSFHPRVFHLEDSPHARNCDTMNRVQGERQHRRPPARAGHTSWSAPPIGLVQAWSHQLPSLLGFL